jgi:hypothetical protein
MGMTYADRPPTSHFERQEAWAHTTVLALTFLKFAPNTVHQGVKPLHLELRRLRVRRPPGCIRLSGRIELSAEPLRSLIGTACLPRVPTLLLQCHNY